MGIDADHTVSWKAEYSREKSREYVALDNTALCVKFVRENRCTDSFECLGLNSFKYYLITLSFSQICKDVFRFKIKIVVWKTIKGVGYIAMKRVDA